MDIYKIYKDLIIPVLIVPPLIVSVVSLYSWLVIIRATDDTPKRLQQLENKQEEQSDAH